MHKDGPEPLDLITLATLLRQDPPFLTLLWARSAYQRWVGDSASTNWVSMPQWCARCVSRSIADPSDDPANVIERAAAYGRLRVYRVDSSVALRMKCVRCSSLTRSTRYVR